MLVLCQSCGHQISDQASACPKCKVAGDIALGATVACRECGETIRSSARSCASCGAPAAVALGASHVGITYRPADSDNSKTPTPLNLKPLTHAYESSAQNANVQKPVSSEADPVEAAGFARGGFGKFMSYVLFSIAVLALLNLISTWSGNIRSPASSGYVTGQVLAISIVASAGLRGILKRKSRKIFDWIAGIYLLFLCGSLFVVAASAFAAVESIPVVVGVVYLLVVSVSFMASATVAVRLLRKPFLPTQS